LKHRIQDR